MLHFAGRVALGVNVGDFLQLQRAFECDGEMLAATEEKEIGGAVEFPPQRFVDRVVRQHGLQLAGNSQRLLHQAARGALVQTPVGLPQVHRQDEQRAQLAGEGLGGCYANFRPRMRVDGAGGFARDHRAHYVADGQRFRSPLFGMALRGQRIGGFAGLRDHHGQRVFEDDRIAITELAPIVDLDRNARQFLDHELAGQSRVPTGAASDNLHLPEAGEFGRLNVHFIEKDAPGLLPHAAHHGVAYGARLLEDFLEHEMLVAAFFRHDGVPEHVGNLAVDGPALEIAQPHAGRREDRHVAIGQEKHVARVAEDGGHVGGHEVFVVADADDHRWAVARGDDLLRIGARNHGQREDAGEFRHRRPHRFFQVAAEVLLDQVGDDLGVGLGAEHVAFGFELMLERQVVLHDAVVHHHQLALAIAVRVSVLFGGAAMRRPPRVADAERAIHRAQPDGIFQVAQFALGAAHGQVVILAIHRQPSRIITAVFQPLQSLQNDRHRLAVPHITDDSTHKTIIGKSRGNTRGWGAKKN